MQDQSNQSRRRNQSENSNGHNPNLPPYITKDQSESDGPLTHKEYILYLERRADGGNWFPFFRPYLRVMSVEEAVLIQMLLNMAKNRSRDGWVLCTERFVEEQLNYTRRIQVKVLRTLADKKFILRRTTGIPPVRSVKVLLINIERAIQQALNRAEKDPDQDTGQ